ncbi:MAG: signal peptidase II [Methylophilaceae bacterium]
MLRLYLISACIFIIDRITKLLIHTELSFREIIEINSFLSIVHFRNKGAAFSLLNDAGGWQRSFLIAVAFIAVIIIPMMIKKYKQQVFIALGLVLILAGAVGNLYDRLIFGYVIDFLYFHIGEYYWPAFNIADSSICFGASFLIYDSIRKKIE